LGGENAEGKKDGGGQWHWGQGTGNGKLRRSLLETGERRATVAVALEDSEKKGRDSEEFPRTVSDWGGTDSLVWPCSGTG